VIRSRDPRSRPVTASLSGVRHWPKLFASDALDFVQVHPYANFAPYRGNLDDLIIASVRDRLKQYRKPVLIGEGGLDSRPLGETLTTSERAEIGIGHAIWASVVSGSMTGRMLWWEDGNGFRSAYGLETKYKAASAPAARFIRDIDYTNFQPIEITASSEIKGAALGRGDLVVGWVRDKNCSAPDWPLRDLRGQSVTVAAPGDAVAWQIEFCDTQSGAPAGTATGRRQTGGISFALPALEGSIAFKLRALASPRSGTRVRE